MAYIDKISVNGAERDLRDAGAARFDETQALTDAQKQAARANVGAASAADVTALTATMATKADTADVTALTTIVAGKVDTQQGESYAGKALVVGSDGAVTLGEAVIIDDTLTEVGQAADAAAVGVAIPQKIDAALNTFSRRSYFYGKNANFLGDSITANTPDPTHTYYLLVQSLLGLKNARNYGVSGSSFADNEVQTQQGNISFCDRYASMDSDADLIVVFGGVNDVWHGSVMGQDGDTTKGTVWGALYVLCSGLIAKYTGKTIVFITPTKQNLVTGNMTCEEIASAIKTTCARFSIPVFDANAELGIYPKDTASANYYTRDKLHLNAAGHQRLGVMLGNYLLSRYGCTFAFETSLPTGPFLFDDYSWNEGGYVGRNGNVVQDERYFYSEKIDISEYAGKGNLVVYTKEGVAGCIYDSEDVLVEALVSGEIPGETSWEIPANAAYMRLNYSIDRGKNGCYWRFVESGGEPLPAGPFSYNNYFWNDGAYIGRDGGVVVAANFSYSEKIDISEYAGKGNLIAYTNVGVAGCIYDSEDVLVEALVSGEIPGETSWEIPANAAYMRLNYQISLGKDMCYWRFAEE